MLRQLSAIASCSQSSVRSVSSKYQRPKPRHYNRRWFEAAVKPELPREIVSCTPPGLVHQRFVEAAKAYDEVELALAKHVRRWLLDSEFRVFAVCQLLPVPGRTLWFATNQWRLKNVEYKTYSAKVMRKVIEGTPMASMSVALNSSSAFLFGRDYETLKTMVTETEKFAWIEPLLFFIDGRVISAAEAKELSALPSLDALRAQTAQILDRPVTQIPTLLDSLTQQLPQTLDSVASSASSSEK